MFFGVLMSQLICLSMQIGSRFNDSVFILGKEFALQRWSNLHWKGYGAGKLWCLQMWACTAVSDVLLYMSRFVFFISDTLISPCLMPSEIMTNTCHSIFLSRGSSWLYQVFSNCWCREDFHTFLFVYGYF